MSTVPHLPALRLGRSYESLDTLDERTLALLERAPDPTRVLPGLDAMFAFGGVGGSAEEFSPFSAVDAGLQAFGGAGGSAEEFAPAPRTLVVGLLATPGNADALSATRAPATARASEDHSGWRLRMAQRLASELDPARFG